MCRVYHKIHTSLCVNSKKPWLEWRLNKAKRQLWQSSRQISRQPKCVTTTRPVACQNHFFLLLGELMAALTAFQHWDSSYIVLYLKCEHLFQLNPSHFYFLENIHFPDSVNIFADIHLFAVKLVTFQVGISKLQPSTSSSSVCVSRQTFLSRLSSPRLSAAFYLLPTQPALLPCSMTLSNTVTYSTGLMLLLLKKDET